MRDFLDGVRRFREFLLEVGAAQSTLLLPAPRMLSLAGPDDDEVDPQRLFSRVVTEKEMVDVCRDLFASGHFSLAIQESCKALEKYVQDLSGSVETGSVLMDKIFSPKSPALTWTERKTRSELDEQLGYHRLYSGTMLGIRNPCTHEFNWVDDPTTALEILLLVQHLLRKAKVAILVENDHAHP